MSSPFGWDLPAGAASDPNAPWNDEGHDESCPCHDDAPDLCQCGHEEEQHVGGKCFVVVKKTDHGDYFCECNGWKKVDPECICGDIADGAKADKAEAMEEVHNERQWNGEYE